eukprot:snap_masked-scaffold_10-processed-gene-2.13-mRNA-1 protein AED:0.44 eAED:0.44 QI:0/-1/0/1/-1/1/1/0/535
MFCPRNVIYISFLKKHIEIKVESISGLFNVNLERLYKEKVSQTLQRLSINISKKLHKKRKHSKHKPNPEEPLNLAIQYNEEKVTKNSKFSENIFNEDFWKAGMKVFIQSVVFETLLNPPKIISVTCFLNGKQKLFVGNKINLKISSFLSSEIKFNWFVFTKKSCDLVSTESTFEVKSEYIGKKIKVNIIPTRKEKDKILFGSILGPIFFSKTIQKAPISFLDSFRKNYYTNKKGEFRIMSYNLLADTYASRPSSKTKLFPYCSEQFLTAEYRFPCILDELISSNSDIFCLQEVDYKVFSELLEPNLESLGFKGVFEKKNHSEGLAIFSRVKYETKFYYTYKLSDLVHFLGEFQLEDILIKKMKFDLNTIFQIICFQIENKMFLLINTHLYFHPEADHIRAFQMYCIVKKIDEVLKEKKIDCPILFCGDLNSSPDSGAIELVTKGKLGAHKDCWKHLESKSSIELTINKVLKSAAGFPEFTNYANDFVETLDYIFVTDGIEVVDVAECPKREEGQPIPHETAFSDHISILADFNIV